MAETTNNNLSLTRMPPQNIEAEQMVLGACILEPQSTIARAYVKPGDFYKTAHGRIFEVMKRMYDRSEQIDLVTLTDEIRKAKGGLESIGGASYLAELVSLVPTAANFRSHERIVVAMSQRRALIRACTEAEQAAYALQEPDATISSCITRMNDIRRHEGDTIIPYSEIIQRGYSEIERRYEKRGTIPGIPTGFRDLDRKLHGLQAQFYVLAGSSGMGKSAFAAQVARNAAAAGHKVGVISLEMGPLQIALRDMSSASDVPLSRLLAGTVHDADWLKLSNAAGTLYKLPIWGAFSAFDVRQIERVIDDMVQRHGVELIICDYLQLERIGDHDGTREQEVSAVSKMHKRKAQQHGVPNVVISALNRALANRQDKRPTTADLRESGSIEYDADVILFVYRDEVYNCRCLPDRDCLCARRGKAEIIVAKGRMEGTGSVPLLWDGATTSFRDAEYVGAACDERAAPPDRKAAAAGDI